MEALLSTWCVSWPIAKPVALVLNPRTGHVSPQFHVKFDDFFELVGDTPTGMYAPEPESKYLSGFAVKKGATKAGDKGAIENLLAPLRGPTRTTSLPSPSDTPGVMPLQQQQDEPIIAHDDNNNDMDVQIPTAPEQLAGQQVPPPQPDQPIPAARQMRSGRVVRNNPCYEQTISQRNQGLVAWEILLDQYEQENVPTAASQYKIQRALENPLVFAASDNPDILYWDQAMRAHGRDKFIEAVGIELDGHEKMGSYEPIPLNQVPKGTKLIDMVWSMRCKRRIKTQEVYKWKACLNIHGGQQEHAVHYWDTYAPVVTWQMVRFFMILSILLGWHSRQLDFVMAYLQAPAEMPLYMRLPQGYKRNGMTRKTRALMLIHNVYGQKQGGQVWNKYMDQGMREIGFTPSTYDPCLYYRGSTVFLVYINDCIVFGPNEQSSNKVVTNLCACSLNFTIDDQGDIGDFLGIQVQKLEDGSIMLTQPQLIDSIIKGLHLQSRSNPKKIPAVTTKVLHKDASGPEMTPAFHYRSVIGKLNFLEKPTCLDISISMHQSAHFSECPKQIHAKAVKRIGHYLLDTRNRGIIILPNQQWHFDCWVDADFAGNWRHQDAHIDPMASKSCSGWIFRFAGVPITWSFKLQTITALSTTEAEYITLSTSLREVIPLMGMLKETQEHRLQVDYLPPKKHCTVFKDNSGALELARLPKIRPRTKHINQSFYHFREYVECQEVMTQATPTDEQFADILTKPLVEATFTCQ